MTLRVQRSIEGERVVLRLTGRIQAEQLPALRALLRSEALADGLVLDLEEVKLVDRETVRFLAEEEAEGASLRHCSAYICEWILQERNAMRRAEAEHPEVSRD